MWLCGMSLVASTPTCARSTICFLFLCVFMCLCGANGECLVFKYFRAMFAGFCSPSRLTWSYDIITGPRVAGNSGLQRRNLDTIWQLFANPWNGQMSTSWIPNSKFQGKHKIVALKKIVFSGKFGPIFKVPCSNNFLFYLYFPCCTRIKIPWIIWSTDMIHWRQFCASLKIETEIV